MNTSPKWESFQIREATSAQFGYDADLAKTVDPAIEREHLHTVKRRIKEIRSGRVDSVNGASVVAEARGILKS